MAKLRVAVVFGGVSSEHEISCISGASIMENMDPSKYEVYKIGITKKGRWLLFPGSTDAVRDGSWAQSPDCVPAAITPDATTHGLVLNHDASFDVTKLDIAFPALHGKGGEDGTVQGLFEMAGMPYVGCDVLSSAVCMDKATANLVFAAHGLPHTPWMAVHRSELDDFDSILFRLRERMSFPIFAKPANAGSSIGVTKVNAPEALQKAMQLACTHDDKILLEQAVEGHEVESAVLGNRDLFATYPGEIISCNEIYDYEAKYQSGNASKLYLPANLPEEKLQEVRAMAEKAFRIMGCSGLARVDFFVEQGTGRVLISEVNTMPGFTTISMYPKLMEKYGLPFPILVDRLIELGLERSNV